VGLIILKTDKFKTFLNNVSYHHYNSLFRRFSERQAVLYTNVVSEHPATLVHHLIYVNVKAPVSVKPRNLAPNPGFISVGKIPKTRRL
jgi:hypothetical protein